MEPYSFEKPEYIKLMKAERRREEVKALDAKLSEGLPSMGEAIGEALGSLKRGALYVTAAAGLVAMLPNEKEPAITEGFRSYPPGNKVEQVNSEKALVANSEVSKGPSL